MPTRFTPTRFTPTVLLAAAITLSVILAVLMLGLATQQRWLGLRLVAEPHLAIPVTVDGLGMSGLWIDATEPGSPAAEVGPPPIPASVSSLVAITGADGTRIDITPDDLMEEPDVLETYDDMEDFFARQSRIVQVLQDWPVELEVNFLGEARHFSVIPARQRPITSLPAAFWMQIGVGLTGFWIGAWIWALRRHEWATRCLAITGAGLMISAFPAAVYSTRELAIPGALFEALSVFNDLGAKLFAFGMVGLFMIYPRSLVSARWLAVPAAVFGIWAVATTSGWLSGPATGSHLPVVVAMTAIIVLVAIQFHITRGDPRDRAALSWLGLAVIVGGGAFVATVTLPIVLRIGTVVTQSDAFLFFLLIYVGVALGVARFRLFQLDEWAFRILFYMIGVLLLLALDAVLIVTIVDDHAPAFATSLLIVALVWLPLRDVLARLVLRRNEPRRDNLFREVMDVALTPPGRDQLARWRALLEGAFRPLSITWTDDAATAELVDDGLGLVVPGHGALPGGRLDYANGGRKLFSNRDAVLAGDLSTMLANAMESREAYETGAAEERQRIARDIHDNIGMQLMGALHSRDHSRKDMMIRETLTDLRDIVNNASSPDLSFDELLADLRLQISEHLFSENVSMRWEARSCEPMLLPIAAAHTLRSVIREAVQNALRHAAPTSIAVTVLCEGGEITITVADDGSGFDPETSPHGNGLANMRARILGLGGEINVASGAEGTRIEARFPLGGGKAG